jgi:membrane protein YdbS with pleckstrin-like domain
MNPFVRSQIKRLPLFANLSTEQLNVLSAVCQIGRFEPGQSVFQQNQQSLGLYLFAAGAGQLTQSKLGVAQETVIAALSDGNYINESSLFREQVETATLRITQSSVILLLPRANFAQVIAQHPDIWQAISNRAAQPTPPPSGFQPVPIRPTNMPPPGAPLPSAPPSMPPSAAQPTTIPTLVPPTTPAVAHPPATLPTPTIVPQQPPAGNAPPSQSTTPAIAPPTASARPPLSQPTTPAIVPPLPDLSAIPVEEAAAPPAPVATPPNIARLPFALLEEEQVLAQRTKHWWLIVRPVLLACIAAGLAWWGSGWVNDAFWQTVTAAAAVFLPGLVAVLVIARWRNNRIYITTLRVIQVQVGLFNIGRQMQTVFIDDIHQITLQIPGPLASLLGYGTLALVTVGAGGNLHLTELAQPSAVQQLIFAQRGESVKLDTAPSNFTLNPLRTQFQNAAGEMVYRAHWLFWWRNAFIPLVIMLAGAAALALAVLYDGEWRTILIGVTAAMAFVGALWLYYVDWDWRNDLYMVGDEAVTIIQRKPLWMQDSVEKLALEDIDSVNTEQNGLFDSLFNIGDVLLSLAGASRRELKRFDGVFNPRGIQEEITRRQAQIRGYDQIVRRRATTLPPADPPPRLSHRTPKKR